MPRWHRVWALARKETRDILRDRRTLFMAIIFPLVLYPLLIIGLIQATVVEESHARKRKPLVAISGREYAVDLAKKFADSQGIRVVDFDGERMPANASVGIVIPRSFETDIALDDTAVVRILYDSADQKSLDSLEKVSGIISSYNREVLSTRLSARKLGMAFVHPVRSDEVDTASPRKRGVFRLGKILAFLLVTFCMMGALYPALDTVAGEKERGTLETLLSIPATRLEILIGKYVAVFGMSVASVVSNFLSLSITMMLVNNLMKTAMMGNTPIDFRVPTYAFAILIPALLPLAALFSAVSLGVAAFARSTREGQYYLAPLYVAALPLTSVALISSMNLTYLTALVPITSISLFLKDGLLGTLSLGPTVVAIVLTCVYAVLALKWAAGVFAREEVLFGAPVGETEIPPEAKGLPRPSHAVLVWAITLILFYYEGIGLARRWGPLSPWTSLVTNVFFILGPAFVLAVLERLSLMRLFRIGLPRAGDALSLSFFMPAALALSIAASVVEQHFLKAQAALAPLVGQDGGSFAGACLSLAVIPAVCEELFYRGFILRTLQSRMSARWAVALSSLLFATAHFNVYEVLPLFVLGVVLALAARATGSLIVPVVVHLINNLLFVYLAFYYPDLSFNWGIRASAAALAAVAAIGVALAWAGSRGAQALPASD